MKRNRRRNYRRNAVTSSDMLHLGIAAVAAFGIGMVIGQKRAQAATPTAGLGAYYQNRRFVPISGLGGYVSVR